MKTVLVTGGNGHLGYTLVKHLSENGFKVRTTVRNKKDQNKHKHLMLLNNVEIVEADLLSQQSLENSKKKVEGIFHTAAPVLMWSKDPYHEIVLPIFKGTQNVFHAAKKMGIKKIIFTSSCSACGMNSTPEKPLVESDWNLNAKSPLLYSKITAEKWASQFCLENDIQLVNILPPTIIGPNFYKVTPSTLFYKKMLLGELLAIPEGGCHLVDVRDVAQAHLNAFISETAKGRYIVAGEFFKFSDFFLFVKKLKRELKFYHLDAPNWLLQIFRFFDWINHSLTKKSRLLTGEMIRDFTNKYQYVSAEKAIHEIHWKPRPAEQSILDTFLWIQKNHLLS